MQGQRPIQLSRFQSNQGFSDHADQVAVEEPLEIRLVFGPAGQQQERTLAVTMRTPGQDEELVRGFLLSERLIQQADQIMDMVEVSVRRAEGSGHTLRVELHPDVRPDWPLLERHVYLSSSCGVCGKASIDAVMAQVPTTFFPMKPHLPGETIMQMPARLREEQNLFAATGGLHACGLFDAEGQLLLLREDVGRHNAADKLAGALIVRPELEGRAVAAVLSGRASFELVQKFMIAGIPILVAVGAPSSLAIDLAQEGGMTLIGFAGPDRFNLYTGAQRIRGGLTPDTGV